MNFVYTFAEKYPSYASCKSTLTESSVDDKTGEALVESSDEIVDVDDVPSPTFTLVQTYDADDFIIYHYDMYRLKTPDEAYELGVEDSFYDGVNLIEWPEKIEYVLPKKSWKIYIKVEENIRYFEIIVENEEQQQRLEKIEI